MFNMTISLEDFVKKYDLADFGKVLELRGMGKTEFYNDFNEVMQGVCRLFDKITNVASLRGGQVLMSLAKMLEVEVVVNKSDVKNCLNIDRIEKLAHAFEYLEQKKFVKINRKTSKFHILNLNEVQFPDLRLFREIVQKFWVSPSENKSKLKEWSGQK